MSRILTFKEANSLGEFIATSTFLKQLENSYPEFNSWYWNKVIPKIALDKDNYSGTKILHLYNKDELIGISILKRSNNEKKLCALRIKEKYQSKEYGLYLIDESLKRLQVDKPLCSVSEDLINTYSRIFINKYLFNISYVYKNIYAKDKLEYEFNGNSNLKIKTQY